MTIIDALVTDRTAGAYYNASDLNRVGEAMQYVAGLLNGYGYAVSVTGLRLLNNMTAKTERYI